MIASDFMVLPHSGKINIEVYCVEHGRWTPSEAMPGEFLSVQDVAPSKVRKAAKEDQAQMKVWEEVEELNEDLDIKSSTGALSIAVEDVKMKQSIQPYQEQLLNIQWPENVVGVVAIRGNELVGIDFFAQHALFMKYYPRLLTSYCSDAYETGKGPLMSYAEVQVLLRTILCSDEVLECRIQEKGTQLRHRNYRIHVAAY